MQINQRVSAEVRAAMGRQRRTQSQLAQHLGVSQVTVSRRLSGEVSFTVDELERVAAFLSVPLAELLTDAAPAGAA